MERPIRVLLVDDQPDFLATISYWMKSRGYEVVATNTCDGALQVIQAEPVDIAFLDVHMPKVDGVETLRRIREITKELPVIMVTAYPENETMAKARQLGISGYFPKEGDFDALAAVMQVALRTHKGLRSDSPPTP